MDNKSLAKDLQLYGKLIELLESDGFKARSYTTAYRSIRNWPEPVLNIDVSEMYSIPGVGKGIASELKELQVNGEIAAFEKLKASVPKGIVEMLQVKGLGPKKVKVIWEEMEIESPGSLLYACQENRLQELKGFGLKTQKNIQQQLEYFIASKGKFLYARVEAVAEKIIEVLEELYPDELHALCGAFRRKEEVLEEIELLSSFDGREEGLLEIISNEIIDDRFEQLPLKINLCEPEEFEKRFFELTATSNFLEDIRYDSSSIEEEATEHGIFQSMNLPWIDAELRFDEHWRGKEMQELIGQSDIKGVIHAHSTYSDGVNTLKQMAEHSIELGYEYLLITDHSQSAFYANGLKENDLRQQWDEIDSLNEYFDDFKIFKGIESDILNDGSLDYSKEILEEFDVVISSIHSNLKMDKDKATTRIIKAIEQPETRIIGHLTGRLLLSREGYPLDFKKVIDACIANNVVIELNANPQRLDIDQKYILEIMEKGGMVSINPDAHSTQGIEDIKYGVFSAKRGGLVISRCLSAFSRSEFEEWIKNN